MSREPDPTDHLHGDEHAAEQLAPDLSGDMGVSSERVDPTGGVEGTGTYNSDWIRGQGTSTNVWRPFTGSPNPEVIPTSAAGNVRVTAPPLSAFDLTYVANNSGRAVGERPPQNIWIGPLTFTALNPVCTV